MSVYISSELYLSTLSQRVSRNRGIIGWHSVLRPQDITANVDGVADLTTTALWSPDTYTFWTSRAVNKSAPFYTYINLQNPAGEAVDYLGIAGHNFAVNETGARYAFRLEYSTNGTTWTQATPDYTAKNNGVVMLHFERTYAQNFRLRIRSDAWTGSPGATFSLAHIRLGQLLRLQFPVYVGQIPYGINRQVDKIVDTSDSGKYLGTKVTSVRYLYELAQENNDPAFVRENILPFLDHAETIGGFGNGPKGTFFSAWRPDDYPDEVLYCHPPSRINRPTNQRSNGMMQWSISGEGEA